MTFQPPPPPPPGGSGGQPPQGQPPGQPQGQPAQGPPPGGYGQPPQGPPPGSAPPPPPGGGYGPPQQGGYAPPPQGGYAPPPQGGYAPSPQGGGYAPPPAPGGGYGAPQGQPQGQWGPTSGRSGASFDPKTVNQLDWGILGAGVLAFIFSFVSYYTYSYGPYSASLNAWHGFFGWFAMLLALVGSAAVALELFSPQTKLPVPNRLIALGAYALAVLCLILALFVTPGPDFSGTGVNEGHGFGYWVSLIVVIAGAVLSFLRFQQSGGQLPGGLSNMGGRGPGGQGGPGGTGGPGMPPPPAPRP